MSLMRNSYKKVFVAGECFLYPEPVIKDNKYLLLVDEDFSEFIIEAFKMGIIDSLDDRPQFIRELRVHSDGRTSIYEFNYSELHFKFLPNRESDLDKATQIEKILSQKIISCLLKENESLANFKKAYLKQTQCSVCEGLGIKEGTLVDFFELLLKEKL
ncbi:MAG: hypothetical protein ACPGJV_04290 [Bacteriovoracaceae bacterium]